MYQQSISNNLKWAFHTANSVIKRKPQINPNRRWEYEDGLVLNGIYQVWKETEKDKYFNYIKYNIDLFVDDHGNIFGYTKDEFNIDHINNGKVLLDLYETTGDPRYKKAADTLYEQLMHQPQTSSGVFWHKNIYPHQVWLDGLYMGSVFYARYKSMFEPGSSFQHVINQFTRCYEHTVDRKTGLCYHAYDESRAMYWANNKTGHSPHFWGRALGWYLMSLVDALEYIPAGKGYNHIITILNDLLLATLKYADPTTGLWYQVVDQSNRPGNYLESSATFMIINAIAKALRHGYLRNDPPWQKIINRAYKNGIEQFITVTQDGLVNVNKMCQMAGLGGAMNRDGSYEYYISEPIVTNDNKGIGPFLLASVETSRCLERADAAI